MPEPDAPHRRLQVAGGRHLRLSHPLVLAILNVTPDSFSDGGRLAGPAAAATAARQAVEAGADILDVGGESTRPGHAPVPADEEARRVVPAIQAILDAVPEAVVSVDTRKAAVAQAAIAAGAHVVNDVSGLDDPAMARLAADTGCGLVVMRHAPLPGDVVAAARAELAQRVQRAWDAGVARDAILVDPGIGFGDPPGGDVAANLRLLRAAREAPTSTG
ncbi:MAG TPA: dihydropteroate synthase, partial [Candidatus Thermoplasmatota archaeon]|nr:dihydropteroate synthase [Candidatus Thermoplasmatota archaeon]